MITSPPIVVVHMGSYYVGNMIHAFIWVIIIARIGVFIGYGYGFEMGMAASNLVDWPI
jgi:hypothetical protein